MDHNALVLTNFNGSLSVTDLIFKHIRVWVRVFDLPLNVMLLEGATLLGNAIGHFLEWDKGPSTIPWGNFLRVRVEMAID